MNRWIKVALLLFFFALCGAAIIATHRASKHTPPPASRELYAVITSQLAALRADDFESAYQHAAVGVQEKFSQSQFELMIRRDFASMTREARVEFGAIQVAGSGALVPVFLIIPDGTTWAYLYSFTAENGGWKINGVQPLSAEPLRHLPGLHI